NYYDIISMSYLFLSCTEKQDLSKDPVLLDKVRQYTSSTLGLNYTSPFKAANDETAAAPVAKAN
ncbi:hypothetical protein, partial [Acinetobacter baumannii]|uniref:hypothetical protein n=2 Tax=Acinetobacter baumannii TaxID=470 RepID=UPI0031F3E408